jgi:hypothetical protein
MKKIIAFAAAIALSGFAVPSFASVESVATGCGGGGSCVELVQAELSKVPAGAARNQVIANIVAALANIQNPGANRGAIAEAISFAGTQSTDAAQQQQVASIASTVSSGAPSTNTASTGGVGGGQAGSGG